ncbi:alpha/beta fold hydrolase [Thiobaca trueperi]|uniref:Alpha/beta hydrolase family protein n=1 Tax=Thiobaca trueperi TaxID=127458 RepID=A0A4R3MY89_9GAMM|nr:alpha/beta hydrolase [Thiobaca trueperi]TCT19239.1 hypothetical protein EDC35_109117 [Thiobaca trueperi]
MKDNPFFNPHKLTVILSVCLVLAGCAGVAAPENRRPGIAIETGTLLSATGCPLHYARYQPEQGSHGDLIVLGPGFLRSGAHLADLAQSLAATGVTTVVLDACADRIWSGSHVRRGFEMIQLADTLAARRVVYAGFSAGALAALVAGRHDPRALGVVALDLVDAQSLGLRMADGMTRPLLGLTGEASACNAYNNGLAVYAAIPHARVARIAGASHCDFESPTDWRCRLVCEPDGLTRTSPRQDIIRMATVAIKALLLDSSQFGRTSR